MEKVIVKDSDIGIEYEYEIHDKEEYKFIESKGYRDESNRLVISTPLVCAIAGFSPNHVMRKVENYVKGLNMPSLIIGSEIAAPSQIDLVDMHKSTNQQLEEYLSIFGGYRAYLDAQLSELESKRGTLESIFEEGLSKALYNLELEYRKSGEKKPIKEVLHGKALSKNDTLRRTRQELIEIEAFCARITTLRDSFRTGFETVSRIASLRIATREQV